MAHAPTLDRLLHFLERSPTPWHAVDNMARRLEQAGYRRLEETEAWQLAPGERFYVTRNDSSLIAMQVPETALSELRMIGAHTDSPGLRLKPQPVVTGNDWLQLSVEVYGGALLAPWFDRDLGLAGRVHVRREDGRLQGVLLHVDRPIAIIPSLAIHLDREANNGRELNAQTQMLPVMLQGGSEPDLEKWLKRWLYEQHGLENIQLMDYELALYDMQRPSRVGVEGELIASARLDNLLSCFMGIEALLASDGKQGAVFVANDHEEVGSDSAQGAGSPFLKDVLERLTLGSENPREIFFRTMANSFFISADMSHAIHPNYAEKHDPMHMPILNGGPVIKFNSNQRYATEGVSSAWFESLCKKAGVPVQKFVVRTDLACGSTIGPITAANLGIRTVDVGNPMLSMHSIREMAGANDHLPLIKAFKEYFSASR